MGWMNGLTPPAEGTGPAYRGLDLAGIDEGAIQSLLAISDARGRGEEELTERPA
jgi:hypothetical protein